MMVNNTSPLERRNNALGSSDFIAESQWKNLSRTRGYGLLYIVFIGFILSLPFRNYPVISTYSLDNLLAPLCCVLAFLIPKVADRRIVAERRRVITMIAALYAIYTFSTVVSYFEDNELLRTQSWTMLKQSFYIFAPLLLIRDRWLFQATQPLIIGITVLAAISTILTSLGIVQLEVERFAESRVNLDWLPKSIGLFVGYGDMAILYSATVVILLSSVKGSLPLKLSSKVAKLGITLALLAGLAGAQSRNVLLTVIVTIGVYYLCGPLAIIRNNQTRMVYITLIFAVSVVGITTFLVFFDFWAEAISKAGGHSAYQTAQGRLLSYEKAFTVIWQEPIFGVSIKSYKAHRDLIESLHNMWIYTTLKAGIIGCLAMLLILFSNFTAVVKNLPSSAHTVNTKLVIATVAAILVASEFYGGKALSDIILIMLGYQASYRWIVKAEAYEYQ